jgi:hypothetical protein
MRLVFPEQIEDRPDHLAAVEIGVGSFIDSCPTHPSDDRS